MIYHKDNSVLIRSMYKSDVEKFVTAFAEQNWEKPSDLFNNYCNQQEKNERSVLVAEVNNEVAGYVTLLPNTEIGPFANKHIPEIVDLNVLIKFQNKGVGNKMMDVA
ncbi:GNAT family N-acetyltransferase [Viridibacillus arvi]|uniref:GNAT family N-acetyltransferase n=1 Tax=Viridibacillus arvi TaxID=263475 RepID=UPI003D0537C3